MRIGRDARQQPVDVVRAVTDMTALDQTPCRGCSTSENRGAQNPRSVLTSGSSRPHYYPPQSSGVLVRTSTSSGYVVIAQQDVGGLGRLQLIVVAGFGSTWAFLLTPSDGIGDAICISSHTVDLFG